jgi:2-dehydro-3-deoxyphosphooctonate aldolase (KDO 8-P synthase)
MYIREGIVLGSDKPVLFSGPCAVESFDICMEIGSKVKAWADQHGFSYVFKASFDKANRTSSSSFRSIGMDASLEVLQRVGKALDVPLVTDIHESYQAAEVAEVVDVLQIPAFLCRQTDLLLAAAATGKAVKIKRGQFMAPEDMAYTVNKVRSAGNDNVCLTERGFSLGYHNLVVDMLGMDEMKQYGPVIFDATHALQKPGGRESSADGRRAQAAQLARSGMALGLAGLFIEAHPDPNQAKCDGPCALPLAKLEAYLQQMKAVDDLVKSFAPLDTAAN